MFNTTCSIQHGYHIGRCNSRPSWLLTLYNLGSATFSFMAHSFHIYKKRTGLHHSFPHFLAQNLIKKSISSGTNMNEEDHNYWIGTCYLYYLLWIPQSLDSLLDLAFSLMADLTFSFGHLSNINHISNFDHIFSSPYVAWY